MQQHNTNKLTAIDLFCGAGGLSQGFRNAGVEILAGFDDDLEALDTFQHNFGTSDAIAADLSNPNPALFSRYQKVDVLLGGPPCQGFSIAGKRNINDPRNSLTKSYLDIVKILSPKIVVIENVPNILSMGGGSYSQAIIHGLGQLGYSVQVHKLNAADFGVPQNRKRVFFIASRDIKDLTEDLHSRQIDVPVTTANAISDLPLLENTLGEEVTSYSNEPSTSYQMKMRALSDKLLNHTAVAHKERTKHIISLVPDGGNYKDLPLHLQGTRKVNIAWTRMNSAKPCFTIDAGHNHHFHYKANRVPTVRECARIQSFPDNFLFKGKRTSQYRQVGNAVPPILAQKIAEALFF